MKDLQQHRFLSSDTRIKDALSHIKTKHNPKERQRIVVLGTGWASVGFLRRVNLNDYDITVVSPRDHFTFNPLLPSVVGGALSAEGARLSITKLFGKKIRFIHDSAEAVDPSTKTVQLQTGDTVTYDHLVFAVGTTNNTFGTPGVEEHSFFLKEWEDATVFRNHVKQTLDKAKIALKDKSKEELQVALHFAIVGAGPTGTETTAELVDLINGDYPELRPYVKFTLIDMMPRVLPMFSQRTSDVARLNLEDSGMVKVLLNCAMMKRTEDSITLKTKGQLPTDMAHLCTHSSPLQGGGIEFTLSVPTVLWASGVTQRSITHDLITLQTGPNQRRLPGVSVDQTLQATKMDHIYVLGDNAFCRPSSLTDRTDEIIALAQAQGVTTIEAFLPSLKPLFPQIDVAVNRPSTTSIADRSAVKEILSQVDSSYSAPPPTAQNANQQGEYLANIFNTYGPGKETVPSFRYHNKGSMCYIGSDRAVIERDPKGVSGLYGTFGSGLIWRSFYSLIQKTNNKRASVLLDFARHWSCRKLHLN